MIHTPRDIKNQAQIIKQKNPDLKLTTIQHELAKKYGHKSFQSLLSAYEKEYKSDEMFIARECKTRLFDNFKEILSYHKKLIRAYEKSDTLRDDLDTLNNDALEDSEQERLNMILDIGKLICGNNYCIIYQSDNESEDSLVFSLYTDERRALNSFEGSHSDYTVILHYVSRDLEIYVGNNFDSYGYKFPQI